jgi:hypothetical protein
MHAFPKSARGSGQINLHVLLSESSEYPSGHSLVHISIYLCKNKLKKIFF